MTCQGALLELEVAAELSGPAARHGTDILAVDRAVVHHLLGDHGRALELLDDASPRDGIYVGHLREIVRACALAGRGEHGRAWRSLCDAWEVVSTATWRHPLAMHDFILGFGALAAMAGAHARAARLLAVIRGQQRIEVSLPPMVALYLHHRCHPRGVGPHHPASPHRRRQ